MLRRTIMSMAILPAGTITQNPINTRSIKNTKNNTRNIRNNIRSITRDINSLKIFLAEHADLLGYPELEYSSTDHCYTLKMEHFLSNKELLAVTKVLIGSRAFNNQDLLCLIDKLKRNTTAADRSRLEQLIRKEMYHYDEIGSDCQSVIDNLWKLTDCIEKERIITISYYK